MKEYVLILDKLIALVTFLANAAGGASKRVSEIIAQRIAEGREWTDAERQEITAAIAENKAYAKDELSKPDVV